MNNQQSDLREISDKTLENISQIRKELYKIMYAKYIIEIRHELTSKDRSDEIFQEAFVVLLEKLEQANQGISNFEEKKYIEAIGMLFKKIIHNILLNIEVSASYLLKHLKGNDVRARERLSRVLLSPQNQNYAKYLVQSLSIRSLDHQDFLQESVIILLQNIENDRFRLEPGSSNEVDRKKIFKYFREIVYRQVHKVYRDDKKLTQLDDQFDHINQSDSLSTADDKFDLAVYQCFYSLDPVSQKMMKHLFSDNLSPKEVAKKMNHPEFPNTKDIVEHKFNCLQKLKSLTSEKLLEMDQKSFNTYLEVSKSALKNLDEPCKTILTNALPPIQKSYKEMLNILKNSKIPEREFLKTEDQVKKRKYKCMITLQDRIWQNLLTQIN